MRNRCTERLNLRLPPTHLSLFSFLTVIQDKTVDYKQQRSQTWTDGDLKK